MDALLTILFFIAAVWLIFRLFGTQINAFIVRRMARRFGMDEEMFNQKSKTKDDMTGRKNNSQPENIVPDDVGEYVDFEEIKDKDKEKK